MGVDKDTYFWEDERVGKSTLCSLYPLLYPLPSFKKSSGYLVVWSKNSVSSFGFRRNLSDREMMEVAYLLSLLEGCSFMKGGGISCLKS